MKLRVKSRLGSRVQIATEPLIGVAILLLMFVLLTLKFVDPESKFNISLPIPDDPHIQYSWIELPDIKVRLRSNAEGRLVSVELGRRKLGHDAQVFARLNSEILKMIGRPGHPLTRDMGVEIEADRRLHNDYVVQAVAACSGRYDARRKRMLRYIERIILMPPQKADDEA